MNPLVLTLHPAQFVYEENGSARSCYVNPEYSFKMEQKRKDDLKTAMNYHLFGLFLSRLSKLQGGCQIDTFPYLEKSETPLDPDKISLKADYAHCLSVARLFGYRPKFLLFHLNHFLGRNL
jgi:hypothetical protein